MAESLTELIHGSEGLTKAKLATDVLHGAEFKDLTDDDLRPIFADVPSSSLAFTRLDGDGLGLIDAFVESGLSKSKGDARRTIQQGGAYVNNTRMEDIETMLNHDHLASESMIVLRSGKKKYALLQFS